MIKEYFNLVNLFFNRDMPTYIVFHVTLVCNSRCKMCFNWKNMNKNIRKNELTLEEINKLSKSFNKLLYVSLGGGEPFLRNDIDKIVQIFYKNNRTRIFQIATNCLQPKQTEKRVEEILKNCKDAVLKITLSLDGIGEDHDEIRGVKGNFEKFKETYKLLSALRRIYPNLELIVNSVYSKYTEKKAKDIYEWVKNNMDVDMHSFTYVRGETKEIDAKDVSIKNYNNLIKYVEKEYRKRKFRKGMFKKIFPVLSILTRRHILRELGGEKRQFKCLAGKRLLNIDSLGNVFVCEYLPTKLGNVRDYDYNIKRIINPKRIKKVLKYIKDKKCSCTWECAIKQSVVYDWKQWPTVLQEILRLK